MPYVMRNENGDIYAYSEIEQPDSEWLDDNDPEMVSFLNPEPTSMQIIQELEAQITDRRKREAILGDTDSIAFIQDIEDQITAERAKL